MSKITCKCVHIVVDQTHDLPCKGYYIKDTHIEELYEVFDPIDQLIDAIKTNKMIPVLFMTYGCVPIKRNLKINIPVISAKQFFNGHYMLIFVAIDLIRAANNLVPVVLITESLLRA